MSDKAMPTGTDHRELLRHGIPVAHDLEHLLAHTRVLTGILSSPAGGDTRASEAAAENARSFDRSEGNAELGHVACRAGCSHCCRSAYVSITAPELFHLARAVRALPPAELERFEGQLLEDAETVGGMNPEQRFAESVACPLLSNDRCEHYAQRPLMCRAMTSRAVEDCIRSLVEKRPDPIRIPLGSLRLGQAHVVTLRAAIQLSGYVDHRYELICGLLTVLADDDSEARWLAGEPVFDGLVDDIVTTESEELDPMVEQVVTAARPGR